MEDLFISVSCERTNERTNRPSAQRGVPRPQMEIPDLYANSIFVAARGVGRRSTSRHPHLSIFPPKEEVTGENPKRHTQVFGRWTVKVDNILMWTVYNLLKCYLYFKIIAFK